MDLIVALAGGAAGAYATLSPRISASLVGVAVATALVPPLSTCGICLARGEIRLGFGGFVLYFTNLIAIQVASSLVLWINGYHRIVNPGENARSLLKRNWFSFMVLTVLVFTLAANLNQTVSKQRLETNIRNQLKEALKDYPAAELAGVRFRAEGGETEVFALVYNTGSFTPHDVRDLEVQLTPPGNETIRLHVQTIIIKEATRDRYLHLTPPSEGADTDANGMRLP
jgi:uncharacterized membrane protein